MPRYGFGRSQLIPIRTGVEAISRYMATYMVNNLKGRKAYDKGARLTRYSRNWKEVIDKHGNKIKILIYSKSSPILAWNSDNGKKWRQQLKLFFVHIMGYPSSLWTDEKDNLASKILKDRFGPSWAYHLQNDIMNLTKEKILEGKTISRTMNFSEAPY